MGGLSDQASASLILSFEANSAGGAGGAVYTTCYSFGICQEAATKTIGLPASSGNIGRSLTFLLNTGLGYGPDIATAPAELVLKARTQQYYVPGSTNFDITFTLRDSQGQIVVGRDETPISHMVL